MKTTSIALTALCICMATSVLLTNVGNAQEPRRNDDPFAERTSRDAAALVRQRVSNFGTANQTPSFGQSNSARSAFGIASRTSWNRYDAETAKALNESSTKIDELVKTLTYSEDDSQKTEAKEEIKAELETQYDLYLTQHEKPLLQLEEKLAKLRKEFDARKAARDDLVKLRLDNIWYKSQGMGWPDSGNRGPSLFPSTTLAPIGQQGAFFDRPVAANPFSSPRNLNSPIQSAASPATAAEPQRVERPDR